jgi:hypothetical protein
MASLISRLLFGPDTGTQAAVSLDPVPGEGGYTLGSGPTGQDGYPGSGVTNRVGARSVRDAKIPKDRASGIENGTYGAQIVDAAHRGELPGAHVASPRLPQRAVVSRRQVTAFQGEPATNLGGMVMTPQPGANTAGENALSGAQAAGGHSALDTQTPYRDVLAKVGGNVPGAQNVGAAWAENYKSAPGAVRSQLAGPRPDQAPDLGWGVQGNVHPDLVTQEVATTDRLVIPQEFWSFDRQFPYGSNSGSRFNNGERLYFPPLYQFLDQNAGAYGYRSTQGRPTTFDVPAPWTGNFYDTSTAPGQSDTSQAPDSIYVAPPSPRAATGTGRR